MVAEHKTPTVDASHDGPDAVPRSGRTKCKGKGKGKEEGKGYGKGKGKTMKGTGRKGAGKSGRFKGGRGEQNDRGYQGQCWSCGKIGHKSSECRWRVDNVDDDDDEVDGYSSGRRSGDQSESEKGSGVGGVWIVGNVEEIEDEEVSDVFSEDGADQRDGFAKFVQINVINSVKFAQSNVTGSVKFAQIGAMNSGFIRGEGRANVRRKRANRKARADKTGSSH